MAAQGAGEDDGAAAGEVVAVEIHRHAALRIELADAVAAKVPEGRDVADMLAAREGRHAPVERVDAVELDIGRLRRGAAVDAVGEDARQGRLELRDGPDHHDL